MTGRHGNETSNAIAIVGLSCRFPGEASTPSRFWSLLKDGRDGFSPATDRYNAAAFYHGTGNGNRQNVIPTMGGYLLEQDPYVFDAAFFNITAAEAMALDPRQRMAMELSYEALENAGMPLQKVAGTQTACFMGASMSDYRDAVARDFAHFPKYHILGLSDEMISNRVSHFLDIHGPSATVQTACSSSLVATHLACQSLRSGESEMAIAGGVGLIIGPDSTMHLNNVGFLNPAGHSLSFDAEAAGYGRGEGCGVLILKRLDDAIRDNDTVRAVIRASGANSDGWTQGVTMPSMEAQAALIKYVYESNQLDYSSTQYVEAHGTGTKVGDPVETGALYRTIGQVNTESRSCLYVGSVKPNIGHLEAAAGIASIIKGVLALEHSLIPPVVRFSEPNPAIPLEKWNMKVPTKLTPWPIAQTKRMSVSGFGMGGTNAHIVMEGFKSPSTNGATNSQINKGRLFIFSSHDKPGLKRIAKVLVEHLDTLGSPASRPAYLADLAHTLATARSGLAWKTSCLADNLVDLREQLLTTVGVEATRTPGSPPRIGFIFTGQGAQWARMGIGFLTRRTFGESVARSATILKELGAGWDPVTELSKEQKESRLGVPEISQPICTVLQIALVDELLSWGVMPSKVVGHSSGEIAAAYTIGALSHRDAIAAAYFRGTASSSPQMKQRDGGMMAVGCSHDHAQKLMTETALQATVACVNSPSNVTLSGDIATLEALQETLEKRGIFARRLKVDVAYHSSHMHLCSAEYYASISDLGHSEVEQTSKQRPIMVSSVTGGEVDLEQVVPYYWVQNLISPVLFVDAVKEMVSPAEADGKTTIELLVEVGPHSALGGPIEQILSSHGIKNVDYKSILTRGKNALDTGLSLAAELFHQGVPVNVSLVNDDSHCDLLTDLPPYPWNHSEKFRADSRMQRELAAQQFPTRSLIGALMPRMDENERVWRNFIRLNDEPWLRGHVVGSTVLFPGAGMISIVLEAALQIVDQRKKTFAFKLRDVSFLAAMSLSDDIATEVTVHLRPHLLATSGSTSASWWEFTVSSCAGPTGQLRNNCSGLISIIYEESRGPQMALEDREIEAFHIADFYQVLHECPETCSEEVFYDNMNRSGLHYGEAFQGVSSCHPGQGKTCFGVKVADIGETFTKGKIERPFLIHAAALDAIFQGWLGSTLDSNGDLGFGKPMVPASISELEIAVDVPADVGSVMHGVCRSHQRSFNQFSANITMFDQEVSKAVLSISDLRSSPLEIEEEEDFSKNGVPLGADAAEIAFEVRWDYALDVMGPAEIKQVVASVDPKTNEGRLVRLLQMVIHQHPTVDVIELVPGLEDLSNTITSRLPRSCVVPKQIHYAIVKEESDSDHERVVDESAFGYSFILGSDDAPLPPTVSPADLILVPHHVSNGLQQGLDSILERLVLMAKPGAMVVIATSAAGQTVEQAASLALEAKGFELVTRVSMGAENVAIYRNTGSSKKQAPERLTNGTGQSEVFVIEPTILSSKGKLVSKDLQNMIEEQGYFAIVKKDLSDTETFKGKTCISLLELEKPLLVDLSDSSFNEVRNLVVSCERVVWLTCGDDPAFGMVDGFARVVNREVAGAKFQILHLSTEGLRYGSPLAVRILKSSEMTTDNEFREQSGLLQVQRIYRNPTENDNIRNHAEDSTQITTIDDDTAQYRLKIGRPGLLDSLHFVRDENALNKPLAEYELELEVKATGVNFRDVMASMGLIPVTELGYEASGIVLRMGKQAAKSFKPGDRVSAISVGGTHATKTRVDARVTAKMPPTMSYEEGAATPTVHGTAYYALVTLAKLRRGQSILIHAAAGGVGQAAIQLAKHLGLVIYITVGTEEKRQFVIKQYGIAREHIFNSRDSSFAKGIQRVTGGRGVDCVLNSLSGELLRISWHCLAHFGKFIEIGRRDITDNMRLDMRPFDKSSSFTFFDMTTIIDKDPDALGEPLNKVFQLLQEGILHVPYPLTVYPVGQVEDAFRLMQQGKHRGKIVLSFGEQDKIKAPVLCKAKDSLKLAPDGTYLIVGGLGGLGRSLALEFVASGARHLAFLSRSGDTKPEAKAIVEELGAHGAHVTVLRGDVGDQVSFLAAMKQCSEQLPPIKGVAQMAMVLHDVALENMSFDQWKAGLWPKVQGTWNLHEYFSHERELDFMIFCSSISGIAGPFGQAQYAAANTYQNALASYRRNQGLKAVSLDLGIMLDVGILAETGTHNLKAWEDALGIREPAFHALMKSAINGQQQKRSGDDDCPIQICVGLGTADILAAHHLPNPPWFEDPRFGPLTVANSTSTGGASGEGGAATSLASRLAEAGNEKDYGAAAEIITGALIGKTADILRIPKSEVDPNRPLYSYGVDSLVAMEVRNWITRELKANMALLDLMAAVPMETFAGQIAQKSKLVMGLASS